MIPVAGNLGALSEEWALFLNRPSACAFIFKDAKACVAHNFSSPNYTEHVCYFELKSESSMDELVGALTDQFAIPVRTVNVTVLQQLKEQLSILAQSGQLAIVWVEEVKGSLLQDLMEVMAHQEKRSVGLSFIFVGDDAYLKTLKKLAKKNRIILPVLFQSEKRKQGQWEKWNALKAHPVRLISVLLLIVTLFIFSQMQKKPSPSFSMKQVQTEIKPLLLKREPDLLERAETKKAKTIEKKVAQLPKINLSTIKPNEPMEIITPTSVIKVEPQKKVKLEKLDIPKRHLFPKEGYTIQLIGAREFEKISHFILKNHLQGKVETLSTFYQGKPWFVVYYGNYPTLTSASNELKNLPEPLKKLNPFVKSFSDVHQIIKQHHV